MNRNPYLTVFISLIFSAPAAMFYLGLGRRGFFYLFATIIYFIILCAVPHFELSNYDPSSFIWGGALINVIGSADAFRLARQVTLRRPIVWFARWWSMIFIIILPLSVLPVSLRLFILETFSMSAGSMLPNVKIDDHVLAINVELTSLKRGDIVVFMKPGPVSSPYLKRIVGTPGDRIQLQSGRLMINSKPTDRTELPPYKFEHNNFRIPQYVETLPEGASYKIIEVEGDYGRMDNTREVIVPNGHYFVLGDNRDNSLDSRFFGFVPAEAISSRVALIYWNKRTKKFKLESVDTD